MVQDDDLFAESTMTFGEHLEELRSALFRSLVGLVAGFLIGMLLANNVVKWVQYPLEKALNRFYLAKSQDDLETNYHGAVPPEMINTIDERGLAPETMFVDENLLKSIAGSSSTSSRVEDYQYTNRSLPRQRLPALCKQIVAQQDDSKSPHAVLWRLLGKAGRQDTVAAIAKMQKVDDAQYEQGLAAINSVLEEPTLFADPAWGDLTEFFDAKDLRLVSIVQLREQLTKASDPLRTARLNRLMLDGLLADHVQGATVRLVEIPIWKPVQQRVKALSAHEPFMIWVKASFITGVLLSSPWIFWQIWSFVAAGLYPHEKRYVYTYLPFSLGLFLAGAALAFCFVFEPVLNFLFEFNRAMHIDPDPRISEWISFVLLLPLGFGISFQLPLVMLLIERIGVVNIKMYIEHWRTAVLGIAVISMLLTPADPISMLLMAVPLTVLYFGGIGLCKWMPKHHSPYGAGIDPR
ncbi:MAG: twin-arginine translocase subunit TatC [Pirellulaceae bacterium]|nr:twin-arginine translocase subunit TatC [Planctomycetales bacterium]